MSGTRIRLSRPVADGEGLTDLRWRNLRGRIAVGDVESRRGDVGGGPSVSSTPTRNIPSWRCVIPRDPVERRDVGRSEPALVAGGADQPAAVAADRVDAPGNAREHEQAAGSRGQPPLRRKDPGPAATGVGRDVVPGAEDVGACRHGGRRRRRAEVEGVGRRRTGRRRSTTRDDSAERDHDHEGRVGTPSMGTASPSLIWAGAPRPDARQRSDRMDEEAMRTA